MHITKTTKSTWILYFINSVYFTFISKHK